MTKVQRLPAIVGHLAIGRPVAIAGAAGSPAMGPHSAIAGLEPDSFGSQLRLLQKVWGNTRIGGGNCGPHIEIGREGLPVPP